MSDNENQPASKNESVRIFNARELGLSLREVAVDVIKREDKSIVSHWFHSSKDADMFMWKDEHKNIIKQQVTFYGQLVEWNVLEGVRTGIIIEDEESQVRGSSPLIRFDSEPQTLAVEQGIDVISHVQGLQSEDKFQIIENFRKSPRFNQMSPEEIMQRYGLLLAEQRRELPTWLVKTLKFLGLYRKNK